MEKQLIGDFKNGIIVIYNDGLSEDKLRELLKYFEHEAHDKDNISHCNCFYFESNKHVASSFGYPAHKLEHKASELYELINRRSIKEKILNILKKIHARNGKTNKTN